VRSLIVRSPEVFQEKQGIDVRVRHSVTNIDLSQGRVRVLQTETGKSWWESFDDLLISTGATPIRPRIAGIDAPGVFELSTLQTGIDVRTALDGGNPQNAVIVGGGFVGLEMAESFLRRGMHVSVIERSPQVMNPLDPDMAGLILDELLKGGVDVFLEESFQGLETKKGRISAVVSVKRTLETGLVIIGLGVRPNVTLAAEAGILLGETGAIRVDSRLQTGEKHVWAAGNCAEAFHIVSRRPHFAALGTVANKQGRVAGINLAGGEATFPGFAGTAVVKVCGLEVARTGLQESEIEKLGWSCVTARIEGRTRAGYYPGAGKIWVKILAEKGSGRLLGGQIVGAEGSAKRIDVVAAALHAGFTVEEMINLDLGYTPPFSPVWDPVLIAARQAAAQG
jgi:NADPH-dependent 2,4-dienoyl-CoA reductase/sulfur reductase-like enzyme